MQYSHLGLCLGHLAYQVVCSTSTPLKDSSQTSHPKYWCCCRERKKAEVLTEKRKDAAPPVVALLPLSSEVHVQQLWNLILGAFLRPGSDSKQRQPKGSEAMDEDATTGLCSAWTQLRL